MNQINPVWSKKVKELTRELHKEIGLNNYNWHKFRANKTRRTAELIICALSQIINEGNPDEIKELLLTSIKWIDNEIQDPGCSHN